MSVAGIIFTGLHRGPLSEVMMRTIATMPFMCRYRLVDFALSNMVNSNITNVNVLARNNYHSLMDHIGSGKDWDLARRSGGLRLLPPYYHAYSGIGMQDIPRLAELKNICPALEIEEDYVVLTDCDTVCNIDLMEMVNDHIEHNADITIGVRNVYVTPEISRSCILYDADPDGRITETSIFPANVYGYKNVAMNIMVMSTAYMMSVIADAVAHNFESFSRDVIAKKIDKRNFRIFNYTGYFSTITDFGEYYRTSMDILKSSDKRDAIFSVKNRPVFTRVRNSAPAKYNSGCSVSGSLIADDCIIDGTVENSILFRGVKVGKGTVVRNSILFQDTYTGNNVDLNCVVTDKNVIIRDGISLSGHESLPFYIDKGKMI